MRGRSRTAIIALTLAISLIVIAILSTAIFAAASNSVGGSSVIKFLTSQQQFDNLIGGTDEQKTGLNGTMDENGNITLNDTTIGNVFGDSLTYDTLKKEHDNLIKQGILRYAIYNGSLCSDATGLIIILDFSNYNITEFKSGFLNGLAYVLVGSNEKGSGILFGKRGAEFTETNEAGGALTVFDSKNGGRVISPDEQQIKLTLRGIYAGTGGLLGIKQSVVTVGDQSLDEGTPINSYSLRIVLPSNANSIHLEKGCLIIEGIDALGAAIVPPTSVGLGISHLNIQQTVGPDNEVNWNENVNIDVGVTTKPHFHWISVRGYQMAFALYHSLNNMLGLNKDENGNVIAEAANSYVDEIFKKPHTYSDFAYLFLRNTKVSENKIVISVYDAPNGNNVQTEEGIAAAISMMNWMNNVYKLQEKKGDKEIEFRHYLRSQSNEIDEQYGVLTCDTNNTIMHGGENCYAVKCTHESESGEIIGYYSASGKLYDAQWKLLYHS